MQLQMQCLCVNLETGEQIGPSVILGKFTEIEQVVHFTKQLHQLLAAIKPHAVYPEPACGFPSSVTGAPCVLPKGHAADSPQRFHRYEPPRG